MDAVLSEVGRPDRGTGSACLSHRGDHDHVMAHFGETTRQSGEAGRCNTVVVGHENSHGPSLL